MIKTINTVLLLFIFTGCTSTSVTKLNSDVNYRSTNPDQISLYLEPEDVECDFERLALINTKTRFKLDNSKSLNAAKKEAAEMGANGLIIKEYKYPTDGEESTKIGTMVAIYRSDTNCR